MLSGARGYRLLGLGNTASGTRFSGPSDRDAAADVESLSTQTEVEQRVARLELQRDEITREIPRTASITLFAIRAQIESDTVRATSHLGAVRAADLAEGEALADLALVNSLRYNRTPLQQFTAEDRIRAESGGWYRRGLGPLRQSRHPERRVSE